MSGITISVLAADEVIENLCADPSLQAQKSPAPEMASGGPKMEPVATLVAIATVVLAADKVRQASVVIANAITKWLAGGDESRQAIEVAIRKQNGDFNVLYFEKGTSAKEIEDTVSDHLGT